MASADPIAWARERGTSTDGRLQRRIPYSNFWNMECPPARDVDVIGEITTQTAPTASASPPPSPSSSVDGPKAQPGLEFSAHRRGAWLREVLPAVDLQRSPRRATPGRRAQVP